MDLQNVLYHQDGSDPMVSSRGKFVKIKSMSSWAACRHRIEQRRIIHWCKVSSKCGSVSSDCVSDRQNKENTGRNRRIFACNSLFFLVGQRGTV